MTEVARMLSIQSYLNPPENIGIPSVYETAPLLCWDVGDKHPDRYTIKKNDVIIKSVS